MANRSTRTGVGALFAAGSTLSMGIAAGGVLTLVFSLLVTRYFGAREYSTLAPLLSFGAIAGVASAGVQNAIMFDIVTHNSFRVVVRHLRSLGVASLVVVALGPFVAGYLRVSLVSAFAALTFAAVTLVSCVPVAMLLARRRILSLSLFNFLQALLRVAVLIPLRHGSPVTVTFAASLGAVLVGGFGMLGVALKSVPVSGEATPVVSPVQFGQYALGSVLFLPVSIPTWLARHFLDPTQAGVFSLAVLLASTIVMFAGPVTSVVTPRVRAGERGHLLRQGAWLTGVFAVVSGLGLLAAAPLVLPSLESTPLPGLRGYLIPLCVGAILWSLALYGTWIDVAARGRALGFTVATVVGLGAQLLFAWIAPSSFSLAWGPALSGLLYGLLVLFEHYRHSSLGPSAG